MKYRCVYCGEILNDNEAIMVGIHSGWSFPTVTIMCNECLKLYDNSKLFCSDCKYWKVKRKESPCKNCKEHSLFVKEEK